MSKPSGGEGEGVSRWKQRQAAKSMMYAMSNERSGDAIAARRQLGGASKYTPQVQGWQGKAWGLASTKVGGRQDPKTTRFSSTSGRGGELYYGQKRSFNSDLPPEDPKSCFLSRVAPKAEQKDSSGGASAPDLRAPKRSRPDEAEDVVNAASTRQSEHKQQRKSRDADDKSKKKEKASALPKKKKKVLKRSASVSSSSSSYSYSSSGSSASGSRSRSGSSSSSSGSGSGSSSASYSYSYSSYSDSGSSGGSDSEDDEPNKKPNKSKKSKEHD